MGIESNRPSGSLTLMKFGCGLNLMRTPWIRHFWIVTKQNLDRRHPRNLTLNISARLIYIPSVNKSHLDIRLHLLQYRVLVTLKSTAIDHS